MMENQASLDLGAMFWHLHYSRINKVVFGSFSRLLKSSWSIFFLVFFSC